MTKEHMKLKVGLAFIVCLGLLLSSCVAPVPTPTTPSVPRTTTPVSTPTPTQPSGPNLTFYTPQGWESPLIVASSPKATKSSALSVGQPVYISFALHNNGTETLPSSFFADVMFNGIVVYRVRFNPLQPRYNSTVTDWADLPVTVNITPGKHSVRVVLDATGLVVKNRGKENVIERELEWAPPATPVPPAPALKRKPNLVPFKLGSWDSAIIATSVKDDIKDKRSISGPLSVDTDTYFSYGIKNTGLTSVTSPFWVYTYVDGVLVDRARWSNKRSDGISWRAAASLDDIIRLSPGPHTVRVEVDATRLIDESSETDNVYQQTFVWGTGPVPPATIPVPTPTPKPIAPAPLTLPNLVPDYSYPELLSKPLDVATGRGKSAVQPSLGEQPMVGQQVFVSVVVYNESTVPATGGVTVGLYFDGRRVYGFSTTSTLPGGQLFMWTWDGLARAAQITPGPHTLKMVIDPDNRVAEASESDNTFETVVTWYPTPTTIIRPPGKYSAAELDSKLAGLVDLLDVREPAVGGKTDWRPRVLEVADAAYYLVTGKRLLDEPVEINLLPSKEFRTWTDSYYMGRFAVSPASEYPGLLQKREQRKYFNRAYEYRRFGKRQIVVDAERTPADLLATIIHESGHMRQNLLNPKQKGDAFNEEALLEAEAQVWEVVVLRAVEERMGLRLSSYPDISDYRSYADYQIDFLLGEVSKDEHERGYLLLWGAALADDVPGLRQEVMNRPLSSTSANRLYEFLVKLPYNVDEYVNLRVKSVTSENGVQLVKSLVKKRLTANLASDLEGAPDLARIFLTTP